ncbi:MAG: DinB family protein [Acidimicrobiia bacterium]
MPVDELSDPRRVHPPLIAGEREMLEAWLDFHRVTLLLKCDGLSDADRKRRPVESSLMSLHGLVRHMADVERGWFQRTLAGRRDEAKSRFCTKEHPDGDFEFASDGDWAEDLRAWEEECEASRATAAKYQLDDTGTAWDNDVSLRWIYVHMIEEYARHNGHADLIREMIDGAVGD